MHTQQTSLQSLEGTVAAASFSDDLQRWQKQLQTIEGVLGVWLKVQQLWTQLEGVCVMNHFPTDDKLRIKIVVCSKLHST